MNLATIEIKAFIPARNFELSKEFYQAVGFTLASSSEGIAYFHLDPCSFLLQDFYQPGLAENVVMHLLVEDVEDWYQHLEQERIRERFQVKIGEPENRPWARRDFVPL